MRYLWRKITSSVLFADVMVRKGLFWTIGEQSYFVYYPITSYQKIKFYRVETVDMGRYHWNNGISERKFHIHKLLRRQLSY